MTRKVLSNMLVLFIVVGVLSACTMSLNGGVPTPVRSDSTQAVLTVMAQLTPSPEVVVVVTQTANVDQAAKSPGGEAAPAKPTAVPSATPQPAAAVATATATVQAPAPAQPTNTSQPESQPESSPTLAPTTAAPTITKTLPPSPTFALDDVRSKLGVPTWRDTFDGSQFWYVYQDERIKFESKDGKLVMTAFSSKLPGGWALVPLEVSTKFYVELDGTFGSACKGRDRFGLIISPNNRANKGYLFDISCEGKYSLWTWDGIEEQALSRRHQQRLRFYLLQIGRLTGENG